LVVERLRGGLEGLNLSMIDLVGCHCDCDVRRVEGRRARRDKHCASPDESSWSARTRSVACAGEGLYVDIEVIRVDNAFSRRSKRESIILSMVGGCTIVLLPTLMSFYGYEVRKSSRRVLSISRLDRMKLDFTFCYVAINATRRIKISWVSMGNK